MSKRHLVALEQEGLKLMQANRHVEAIGKFFEILEEQANWEHGAIHYDLACCYEDTGDIENAREYYERALSFQPEYDVFLGGYASFLYLYGSPVEALEAYLKLLAREVSSRSEVATEKTLIGIRSLAEKLRLSPEELARRVEPLLAGQPYVPKLPSL